MKLITSILLFTFIIASQFPAQGQPCGPSTRIFNYQVLLTNKNLHSLNIKYHGGLMNMYGGNKTIPLEYTIINPDGKILLDTSVELPWPEMHYDYFDCQCTYGDNKPTYLNKEGKYTQCANFSVYELNNSIALISLFMSTDIRNLYIIKLDKTGKISFENKDLSKTYQINSDLEYAKSAELFIRQQNKNSKLIHPPKTEIKYLENEEIYNFRLNQNAIVSSVILHDNVNEAIYTFTPDTLTEEERRFLPSRYKISSGKWATILEGYLAIYQNKTTGINQDEQFLYITVINSDNESCRGYGPDLYPLIYKIDKHSGNITWKTPLHWFRH